MIKPASSLPGQLPKCGQVRVWICCGSGERFCFEFKWLYKLRGHVLVFDVFNARTGKSIYCLLPEVIFTHNSDAGS